MKNELTTGLQPKMLGRCFLALFLAHAFHLPASDWPQYRGPTHDGVSTDRTRQTWPAAGPALLWQTTLTDGFSSFAVSQGKAYTLVERLAAGKAKEMCLALDAATGAELWATAIDRALYTSGGDDGTSDNRGGDGPRSTPSVDGNRVYTLSAYQILSCLDAASGDLLWQRNIPSEYGGQVISWQNSASPLVEGGLVFVNSPSSGRNLMAFEKLTGELAWSGFSDKMTHATPVSTTILSRRQVIFFTQSGLVSVVPETGVELWRYSFPYNGTSTAASPVVAGDIVYCSSGYNVGAAAIRLSLVAGQFKVTELWRKSNQLMNQWSTPVHYGGYLYGLFGHAQYGSAPLKCVELATGKEKWSQPGFGPGGVLAVQDKILVLSDTGELLLVQPNPQALTIVSRFQAVAGKCWNSPAVADGMLYVRSTQQGACYDLSDPAPPRLRVSATWVAQGLQLALMAEDGSDISAGRLSKIQVRTATSLLLDISQWEALTSGISITNGFIQITNLNGALPQQFFILSEAP